MSTPASSDILNSPRLGLIGLGRWGRNMARSLAGTSSLPRLAAAASRNPDAAALLPPGCRVFTDWRDMLNRGNLDGVILATPPARHAEMALAAIAAGIAVLVEKPLTASLAEAESLAEAALAAGVPVMVDHIHLYNPAFRRLVEMVPKLGRLHRVRSLAGNRGPYRRDASVLWDWGPHDVSMMLRLFGSPPAALAARRLERAIIDGTDAETLELTLDFGDGATGQAIFGTLTDRVRMLTAHCDGGVLLYDDLAPTKLMLYPPQAGDQLPPSKAGRAIPVATEMPLNVVLREFAAVAAGGPADDGLSLGVEVVRILARAEGLMGRI